MGAAPGIDGLKGVRAVAEDEPLAGFDFVAAEFGQAGVVSVQALEEEQQRIAPVRVRFGWDGPAPSLRVPLARGFARQCSSITLAAESCRQLHPVRQFGDEFLVAAKRIPNR